ncbi:MAG TPA: DNA helicase RecQ [Kiloniellales bacterium]|nr:DNA helicase RecQ [Kiloniellales bacterium]
MSPPAPADLPPAAAKALKNNFGFADFRPGQAEIVAAVLAGEPLLAVMPTGAGKSLCYQLPALLTPGVTLVVSPLIALMRDQVAALTRMGIAAGALTSGHAWEEVSATQRSLREGRLKLLYLSPERLARPDTVDWLAQFPIQRLAVDEAHCISQWGHDFRPEYRAIGGFARALGNLQLIAFTATADKATREDIAERLFDRPPRLFVQGFYRPNLHLAMAPKQQTRRQLARFLAARRGQSGIVYTATRKRSEELAADFAGQGIKALAYHAGLPAELRNERQARFQSEDGVVMVATVAFGMGIDKPDIRFVAHADLPKSIEAYYQEVGRAGRDGLPADTLALYGLDDMRLRRLQIDEGEAPEEVKRVERQRLAALLALMESPACRWQAIRRYFGEESEPCGHCDACAGGVALVDGTVPAQKALSAILRTGQRFGSEHLIDLLLGEPTERIRGLGHDRLPTFGVGKELDRRSWRGVFRQLLARGLIESEIGGYGGWRVTQAARPVLRGEAKVELRPEETRRLRRERVAKALIGDDPAAVALLASLRAHRLGLARAEQVPAYVIFPDRTLIDMAERRPKTLAEMAEVHGVGQAKLKRYGESFLAVIAADVASKA